MPLLLTGCGLTQKISDSTSSAVKSVFYKQVNVLHLGRYRPGGTEHR